MLIGVVEWRGGDQCGGFLDRQWWVSALWLFARSIVSLCLFFFFLLVIMWWLFVVDVVVVGGF